MPLPDELLDEVIADAERTLAADDDARDARDEPASAIESYPEDHARAEEITHAVVDPLADGISVSVSADRMTATLVLPPLRGAPAVEADAVVELLRDEHHLVDVDTDAVAGGLLEAARTESEATTVVVAYGEPAVDGEDGRIEWLGDFFESHAIRLPDGRTDHYQRTKTSVYEGQPVLTLHAPTKGTPGCDVRGQVTKAAPGRPVEIDFDETIRRDAHVPNMLCAARAGMVEFARDALTISEVLVVDEVSFATGSIDFEGAVQVQGSVAPQFAVVAGGTIVIGGTVENARIESSKSISVDKGVMGRGDAVLISAGDLDVGFARETAIQCGGRLIARRELLWCDGEVHGDMVVESGRVVGGHWRVGGLMIVDEIGSREEVTTIITLGEAPEQNRALHRLTRERKKYQELLARFRLKYQPVLAGQMGALDPKQREALEQRHFLYTRQANRSRKREFLLRKRLHLQRRSSFVWVRSRIFAGTRVRLNGGTLTHVFVEDRPGPVCVQFDAKTRTARIESGRFEDCVRNVD